MFHRGLAIASGDTNHGSTSIEDELLCQFGFVAKVSLDSNIGDGNHNAKYQGTANDDRSHCNNTISVYFD
jgi:hypothetical protein